MGFLDALLGRKQLKDPARDRLFALSTARITLEAELDLRPAGVGAVCFKSMSAAEFVRAEKDLHGLLDAVARDTGTKVERKTDDYGFEWLIAHDADFEDLVATIHLVGAELESRGFGPQLLAAVFRFDRAGQPAYWIYGYKRGAFWPFVPSGESTRRDNATELELKAKLEKELPIEEDTSRWFGTFDAPL
ncbi:hypothetical protein Gocc_0652 [Gaiella occulta]|uniref:Uncharacterized protein n=1 Tax=Gaiella occulta TaxID=1002870 RepID=A0A7M2Z2W6_9ACTN|nr:hypothetical protein [Gaiella occulta]RDI76233.1 hypothetical protein Gocc_0652 [Gaiella occulta]